MSDILIIEDDPILARGLQVMLRLEGYCTVLANSLASAKQFFHEKILLVILDINLPDGSGFDFLKHVRAVSTSPPIIILTAKTDEDDVAHGLELGANDYIRKPFGNRELIARIHNTLKTTIPGGKNLQFGDIELLLEQRKVKYLDEKIELNRREFDILQCLFEKAETIVTRNAILNYIDKDCRISDRTIDSHISHLRFSLKKAGIEQIKIASVYGIGYRLEKA